jgi:hypothetical protein
MRPLDMVPNIFDVGCMRWPKVGATALSRVATRAAHPETVLETIASQDVPFKVPLEGVEEAFRGVLNEEYAASVPQANHAPRGRRNETR